MSLHCCLALKCKHSMMRWWLMKAIPNHQPNSQYTQVQSTCQCQHLLQIRKSKRCSVTGSRSYFMFHMMETEHKQTFTLKMKLQALYWNWNFDIDLAIVRGFYLITSTQKYQLSSSSHTIIIRALNSPPTSNHPHTPHIRSNTTHPLSMVPLRQSPLCLAFWQFYFSFSLTWRRESFDHYKWCFRVCGLEYLLLMISGDTFVGSWLEHMPFVVEWDVAPYCYL